MRIHKIKLLVAVMAIVLTYFDLDAKTGRYRLMWQENPSTTMGIGWDQLSGNGAKLYFDVVNHGEFPTKYAFSKAPDNVIQAKGMSNHFVHLGGLRANTLYYFVIADSDGSSSVFSFKTAPSNNGERLSIIAGSDSRNHRTARVDANKMVSKLRPHCIMFGGDFTENDVDKQWQDWFDDWQHTISSDGRLYPIIVARGNHEYSNKTLMQMFDIKNKNIQYAMNLGGDLLRIYTLNSMMASGGDQKKWLQRDLAQNPHVTWKTAHYHLSTRPHCAKKSENNDQWGHWSKLFFEYGVKFVVESDAHTVKATYPIRPDNGAGSEEGFIRDDDAGTVYVGEGCWGAPLRRNDDQKSWTRASGSFNSFHWIFVDRNKVEIRFVKTDGADRVQELSAKNIFSMPRGLNLWNPPTGDVIVIRPQGELIPMGEPKHSRNNRMSPEVSFEIIDFKIERRGDDVVIDWNSINESFDVQYELQRSVNKGDYSVIKTVQSKGGNSNDYRVVDRGFARKNPDTAVRYRLNQKMENGESRMEEMPSRKPSSKRSTGTNTGKRKPATKDSDKSVVQVDPKTKIGVVRFISARTGKVTARLFKGKTTLVKDWPIPIQKSGPQRKGLDFRNVPKGDYILVLYTDSKDVIRKIKVKI